MTKLELLEALYKEPAIRGNAEYADFLQKEIAIQIYQQTSTCYIDSEGYERCSVCNEYEPGMRYFNFCPCCGAKIENHL